MAQVLIVDDALFVREALKKILTDAGHTVVGEADNGKSSIEEYARVKPDLVLLDITMPIMDGLTALGELMKADPAARVIMCTALGQEQKVSEALEKGARDYVVKPFSPSKIIQAIEHALAE